MPTISTVGFFNVLQQGTKKLKGEIDNPAESYKILTKITL